MTGTHSFLSVCRRAGVCGLLGLLLAGCASTAGPFITRITGAGPGLLAVERCEVEFSPWGYGQVSTVNCRQEMMQLWAQPPMPPPPPQQVPAPPAVRTPAPPR